MDGSCDILNGMIGCVCTIGECSVIKGLPQRFSMTTTTACAIVKISRADFMQQCQSIHAQVLREAYARETAYVQRACRGQAAIRETTNKEKIMRIEHQSSLVTQSSMPSLHGAPTQEDSTLSIFDAPLQLRAESQLGFTRATPFEQGNTFVEIQRATSVRILAARIEYTLSSEVAEYIFNVHRCRHRKCFAIQHERRQDLK